jgi:uncharacterized membrane protein
MSSLFQAFMLICFGAAWPASIYRSYKSRTVKGKSVLFLYIVLSGYICGMISNILNGVNYVLIFYILDFAFVSVDLGLYYRNKRIDS